MNDLAFLEFVLKDELSSLTNPGEEPQGTWRAYVDGVMVHEGTLRSCRSVVKADYASAYGIVGRVRYDAVTVSDIEAVSYPPNLPRTSRTETVRYVDVVDTEAPSHQHHGGMSAETAMQVAGYRARHRKSDSERGPKREAQPNAAERAILSRHDPEVIIEQIVHVKPTEYILYNGGTLGVIKRGTKSAIMRTLDAITKAGKPTSKLRLMPAVKWETYRKSLLSDGYVLHDGKDIIVMGTQAEVKAYVGYIAKRKPEATASLKLRKFDAKDLFAALAREVKGK